MWSFSKSEGILPRMNRIIIYFPLMTTLVTAFRSSHGATARWGAKMKRVEWARLRRKRADSRVTVLYYQYGSRSIQPYRILPRRHGSHDHRPLGIVAHQPSNQHTARRARAGRSQNV
ncbi:hypothetical protein BJV77DRAFT_733362 [Russula vinacea]|nr:hypothetical protein BJV77DRAFT_733362 [Russula vinacea]